MNHALLACHNAAHDIAELQQDTECDLCNIEKAVARIIYGHVLEAVNRIPVGTTPAVGAADAAT